MGNKSRTHFMILYITVKYVRCGYFLLLVLCDGRQLNPVHVVCQVSYTVCRSAVGEGSRM